MLMEFKNHLNEEDMKIKLLNIRLKDKISTYIYGLIISLFFYLWIFILLGNLCFFTYYLNLVVAGLIFTAYLYLLTAEAISYKLLRNKYECRHISFKYHLISEAHQLFFLFVIIYFLALWIVRLFL